MYFFENQVCMYACMYGWYFEIKNVLYQNVGGFTIISFYLSEFVSFIIKGIHILYIYFHV